MQQRDSYAVVVKEPQDKEISTMNTESCHDANFFVTNGNAGCRHGKCCATCDDKVAITTDSTVQCIINKGR